MTVAVAVEAAACCTGHRLLGHMWRGEAAFPAAVDVHWHICLWVSHLCSPKQCVRTAKRAAAIHLQPRQPEQLLQRWLVVELVGWAVTVLDTGSALRSQPLSMASADLDTQFAEALERCHRM